jgi:hypothetical protein
MREHPLVMMVRSLSGDPVQHAQVAEIARRLQGQIDEALQLADVTRARVVLPVVVRAISLAAQQLVGGGLATGSAWFDQAHRQLYLKAEQLLGPGQGIVQRPSTEPMPRPRGMPGQIFPRA